MSAFAYAASLSGTSCNATVAPTWVADAEAALLAGGRERARPDVQEEQSGHGFRKLRRKYRRYRGGRVLHAAPRRWTGLPVGNHGYAESVANGVYDTGLGQRIEQRHLGGRGGSRRSGELSICLRTQERRHHLVLGQQQDGAGVNTTTPVQLAPGRGTPTFRRGGTTSAACLRARRIVGVTTTLGNSGSTRDHYPRLRIRAHHDRCELADGTLDVGNEHVCYVNSTTLNVSCAGTMRTVDLAAPRLPPPFRGFADATTGAPAVSSASVSRALSPSWRTAPFERWTE